MKLWQGILELLFPSKCLLCGNLLTKEETDLCHGCRKDAPAFAKRQGQIRFVSDVTAVWEYRDQVRRSLLRYKFYNSRSLAKGYGRLLAMKIVQAYGGKFDMVTWIPVSAKRRRQRGYDQVELIAKAVCAELGCPLIPTLVKHRNTKANSGLATGAQRRANVLGAYRLKPGAEVCGRRIVLLDDIVTTGATASECARVLAGGGAKEVYLAAVASAEKEH